MDKEMMDKINEILGKANGRRELKMDEADQISGGWREDQMTGEEAKIWDGLLKEWHDLMGGSEDALRMIAEKIAAFGKQMKEKYDK